MSVTRLRYLLDQWRLRSLALTQLEASPEVEREHSPADVDPEEDRA